MNITRFLRRERVHLNCALPDPLQVDPETYTGNLEKAYWAQKRYVLECIVEVLTPSEHVLKPKRLVDDFMFREKKCSTAIGHHLAVPHIRSRSIKSFMMAVVRFNEGVWFDAPDGEPVCLFIAMTAPPHDDDLYLKVYKWLGEALADHEDRIHALCTCKDADKFIWLLKSYA